MIEVKYTIAENAPIASGVYRLKLEGDTSAITAPVPFLHFQAEGSGEADEAERRDIWLNLISS